MPKELPYFKFDNRPEDADGFGDFLEFISDYYNQDLRPAQGTMYIIDGVLTVHEVWEDLDKENLQKAICEDVIDKLELSDGAYLFEFVVRVEKDDDGYQSWEMYFIEYGNVSRHELSPLDLKFGILTIPPSLIPVDESQDLPF